MFTKVSKDPAVFVQMGVTEDELRNDTNPGFQARERQDLAFQVENTSFIVKTIKQLFFFLNAQRGTFIYRKLQAEMMKLQY